MLLRLSRHRLRSRILLFLALSFLSWILLPYDNGLVLLVRWHFGHVSHALAASDAWMRKPPAFPLGTADVGLIVKTGFSTQERLVARLETLGKARDRSNVVLVGDYATGQRTHFKHNGAEMPVYNALAYMVDSGSLASRPNALRLQHYRNLTNAISGGETDLARYISSLEIGYKVMPDKKWYVLSDDDSYPLDASLEVILGNLNPLRPYYIGNAIGNYQARFAHGGSAVVFSQAALYRIFVRNTGVVSRAHLESLDSNRGDKLIATTAMKSGIYLEERYSRYFNGEPPRLTRIRPDRFCAPVTSFHNLSPSQMHDVGKVFKSAAKAISWVDIWKIYTAPNFENFLETPTRSDWDHVGVLDDGTMNTTSTPDVATKEACLNICLRHDSTCLAWTWEAGSKACYTKPWLIVGSSSKGKFSGINAKRAMALSRKCR
ncbi:uncharacterized protein BP5553_03452 [Venustampulla echinocandica]|uniref:Apple domain-containing protein n=1 Tax=Venustampulla echinocandica TaxID=2656787 RepID=A0A370TUA3_9HELO|nr:uncharacterized protein BP5553_03452 [Venustampulla echinocandica]RDL39112.1 hypothetical protein BP5553_03452 [Venustampulla echinocandica]